jgi:hypothetical protein
MTINFDWEHLTTLFFALAFISVILMTVGFYINYKRDQWQKLEKPKANPIRGRFFKRYIPSEIKQKYSSYFEA